ncbi:MAG: molybdenum cofactor guanylyltransferase [Hyphomonadaceae bacterium]
MRAAAILAGGESRRFGADKVMADVAGQPMVARVAALLGGDTLAVVGHAEAAVLLNAADLRDPADAMRGPLAGVLAALNWAESMGAAWLLTAPCDTPLLPPDLYPRLIAAAEAANAAAAHARTDDGVHALCAVWRPALAVRLRASFAQGVHPPVRELAPDAVHVHFADGAAFLNVNTPDDLARAAARIGGG